MFVFFTEASVGCPIPDLRFSRPKKFGTTTTEQPYVTFETTQIYLPEDFTTADLEYIENGGSEAESLEAGGNVQRQTRYTDFNPYAWGGEEESATPKNLDEHDEDVMYTSHQQHTKHERRKLRKNSSGRRRFERPYLQHQHKQTKREVNIHSYPSSLISSSQLSSIHQNVYYVESTDIKSSLHSNQEELDADDVNEIGTVNHNDTDAKHYRKENGKNLRKHTVNREIKFPSGPVRSPATPAPPQSPIGNVLIGSHDNIDDSVDGIYHAANRQHYDGSNALGDTGDGEEMQTSFLESQDQRTNSTSPLLSDTLRRVKRKSGKTTGALSRPKGASDSGSKSTSRKKDGELWLMLAIVFLFL